MWLRYCDATALRNSCGYVVATLQLAWLRYCSAAAAATLLLSQRCCCNIVVAAALLLLPWRCYGKNFILFYFTRQFQDRK
jgi:hypothetical protein